MKWTSRLDKVWVELIRTKIKTFNFQLLTGILSKCAFKDHNKKGFIVVYIFAQFCPVYVIKTIERVFW